MKKEIKTEILINAVPEKVWAVLTDFDAYPDWNPFVHSLTGQVKEGNTIKVVLEGMTFKPRVLIFDPNREFRWRGQLFIPGLFDGEHSFVVKDNGNGTTTFHQNETFSGLLVGLLSKKLDTETLPGFERMNKKLKERVEGG